MTVSLCKYKHMRDMRASLHEVYQLDSQNTTRLFGNPRTAYISSSCPKFITISYQSNGPCVYFE